MMNYKKTSTLSASHYTAATGFVLSDSIALASHMNNCVSARSRFASVHAALDFGHAVLSTRIVTCAVMAAAVVGMLALVGMV